MTTEILFGLLLGHLFGDYVFQNRYLALNKQTSSYVCALHCLIYTACIWIFSGQYDWRFLLVVFGTHFIIDRFSLAIYWLKLIKADNIKEFLENGYKTVPADFTMTQFWHYLILRGSFSALVYAVTDNTWHITINYFACKFLAL